MKLKELVHWDQSKGGSSPAFWVDEDSGDFYFQGFKASEQAKLHANVPGHEDLIRVPESFWKQLVDYAKTFK